MILYGGTVKLLNYILKPSLKLNLSVLYALMSPSLHPFYSKSPVKSIPQVKPSLGTPSLKN